ncbi:serpin family protein [Candidatus Zixiibacteriota bacterium]
MKLNRILTLLLLGSILVGCGGSPTDPTRRSLPRSLSEQEIELIASDNIFGLNLFRAIAEAEGDTNIFISPLSVSMALGMTLNGATGETYTAMQEALELAGLTEEEINQAYRSLIDLLTNLDPKVIFEIANSIWYREDFNISPTFVDVNQTYFDAVVRALDFSATGAAGIINQWVSNATHGKIEEIIKSPISPATVMFLINAIYFKGLWTYQFDSDDTVDGTFYVPGGATPSVPMMTMSDVTLPYYEGDWFEAVDMAYGDSCYSMTIILPKYGLGIGDVLPDLDQATWDEIVANLQHREFDTLKMPKWKLEYEITMNDVLTALGMGIAFDAGLADFSRMRDDLSGGLFISKVKHKTFIEVDEKGTEAAAVTVVIMDLTSIGPSMVIDRPFIYVIRERHSGTILFIGMVTDPSLSS